MSFLLAAQVMARRMPSAERRRVAGFLEANQAGWFKDACDRLADVDLPLVLGLPQDLPPPRALPVVEAHAVRPSLSVVPPVAEVHPLEQRRPGFRVVANDAVAGAARWSMLGLIAGVISIGLWPQVGPGAAFLGGGLTGAVFGFVRGRRRSKLSCADCERVLEEGQTFCPGCGVQFVRDLENRDQRLDAREALERKERASLAHVVTARDDADMP
ncbi:MAG: hypothetical protein JST92_12275 [Deltaproteobacteria bacterium]|nr:hypothetical protein [Deltaproteobacteria bacterium]